MSAYEIQHAILGWRERVIGELVLARPRWLLLLVSMTIGCGSAFDLLPLDTVAGTGDFWAFPRGTIPNSGQDMETLLVGYTYFVQAPWTIPLLEAPLLGLPPGNNIFWLDPVSWVAVLGKVLCGLTGAFVNPYGVYLLACFALPGVAMTALLAVLGQRTLLAAIAGSVFAGSAPFLLWRWGHVAPLSHFLIILGLALYCATLRKPLTARPQLVWAALLALVALTNIYLFAMVALIWLAAFAQKRLEGPVANLPTTVLAAALAPVALFGRFTGYSGSLQGAGFGSYSMDLLSPIVPQFSGVIHPLSHFIVGAPDQYEGFAYIGFGTLLLVLVGGGHIAGWLRNRWRSHIALLAAMLIFLALAVSNRVTVAGHVIFDLPLPNAVLALLSMFRSSGRFFWPVGYAAMALSLVTALRNYAPRHAVMLLGAAMLLQWIDVIPLRAAVRDSAAHSAHTVFERHRMESLVRPAKQVMVFPSFGCVAGYAIANSLTVDAFLKLLQANLEVQLAAARANIRVNSVYLSRSNTDCEAERAMRTEALHAGTLYVFLDGLTPSADQTGGAEPDRICETFGQAEFCRLPL